MEIKITKNNWSFNLNTFILLAFILVGSVILSSTVSAAVVTNLPKAKLNNDMSNCLQNNQPHSVDKFYFHATGTTDSSDAVIGSLKIPRLGVNCSIRSDTVNAYNAAYHYPESVALGQPGECGLMSHRTTYSALFRHLDWLKIGDNVIVTDLMRTKYTYSVTSNGNDIRWDYKTNPIKFEQSGPARLLLVTCHPPGYEKAAFITHCKLVAADYLPKVLLTAPQNMKINMNRTSIIAVKFSEKIKTDTFYNNIKVKNLRTNNYVPISKFIGGNLLYIKTIVKRSPNTWYQVTIPIKSIKDYTNNNMIHTYTFMFKTGPI